MRFRIQYILLGGCKLPVNSERIIREAFNIEPFKGCELEVKEKKLAMPVFDGKKTFYRNIVERFWARKAYRSADFTIVFCDKRFYNESGVGERKWRYSTADSVSYIGYPGKFNTIPAMVNLQTAAKKFMRTKSGVRMEFVNLEKDLMALCRHEPGHAFGLDHCEDKTCVMNNPRNTKFCAKDLKIIEESLGAYCGK